MQTEALAVYDLVMKGRILCVHIKKGLHVTVEIFLQSVADIAGAIFLGRPGGNGIVAGGLFSQAVCERDFSGRKVLYLLLKFLLQLLIMCFQNQRVAERVAVVKHFFHMGAAEADLVRLLTDVALHIGRGASKHKVDHILFQLALNKAERAFVIFIHRVIERDCVELFFHISSLHSAACLRAAHCSYHIM